MTPNDLTGSAFGYLEYRVYIPESEINNNSEQPRSLT